MGVNFAAAAQLYEQLTLSDRRQLARILQKLLDALRATGAGLCFNGGRLAAASVLVFSGWLKSLPGLDLRLAVTLLSLLFLAGVLVVLFLPETKDQPLPE